LAALNTSAFTQSRESETRLALIEAYAEPILPFLYEETVLDVCVNEGGVAWVNRLESGWSQERNAFMEPHRSALLLQAIATLRRRELNEDHPILETTFPLTGDRIEGVIEPVVVDPVFAIRTRPKKIYTLADYEAQGILTRAEDPMNETQHRQGFLEKARGLSHGDVLRLASVYWQNVLIVGQTGSGKSTAANALIADWLEQTPNDRAVIIEDTTELQCSLPNYLQLLTCPAADQAKLLETALRLIPKRIVVGEVRSARPAQVLLEAWNTGHRGGLATIHANDALAGLRKLESFVGAHSGVVREQIADAVDLVIFIDGEPRVPARRKIREILAVTGFDLQRQDYNLVKL